MKNKKNRNLFDYNLCSKHSELLGYKVSSDYFEKSKNEILKNVAIEKRSKFVHITRKVVLWSTAASVALLLSLTLFKPSGLGSINDLPTVVIDSLDALKNQEFIADNHVSNQDVFLLNSLFVEDGNIDEYVDNYILESLIKDDFLFND